MTGGKKKKKGRNFIWPLSITLFLALTLTATFYFIFLGSDLSKTKRFKPTRPGGTITKPEATAQTQKDIAVISAGPVKKKITTSPKPTLVLIIDDMGYNKKIGQELLAIKLPITFAFLPLAPHSQSLLAQARNMNKEILLHLPMEAKDPKWAPGPGGLMTSMPSDEIRRIVNENLAAISDAVGVNNHMGSRFTAHRDKMAHCLAVIKERGLFFIDSVTSSDSIAYELAREMDIPTARRNIFLDNEKDPEAIIKQLEKLIRIARTNGYAIGIGHPYPATLAALNKYQNILRQKANMVSVKQIVK